MLEKIEDAARHPRRGNVLAAMAKLKQVCNHPAQLLHDGSADRRGAPARSCGWRRSSPRSWPRATGCCASPSSPSSGTCSCRTCPRGFDTDVAFLHGGHARRSAATRWWRAFQAGEGPPVLLLSLKAGGTGLTLTAANHVVHLDRWWNPAVEKQATDRAFRIGQRRNVQVRKFLCPGTVEERIDAMIALEERAVGLVVGDGEGWLTELSTATCASCSRWRRGAGGRRGGPRRARGRAADEPFRR